MNETESLERLNRIEAVTTAMNQTQMAIQALPEDLRRTVDESRIEDVLNTETASLSAEHERLESELADDGEK